MGSWLDELEKKARDAEHWGTPGRSEPVVEMSPDDVLALIALARGGIRAGGKA